MAAITRSYPPSQKNWFERHWAALITGIVLLIVVAVVVFLFCIFALLRNSDPAKIAFAKVAANPAVLERMGQPIKEGMIITGSINVSVSSGHADLKLPISGPKAKGSIYLTADKKDDQWILESLEVAVDGEDNRIELVEGAPTSNK